MIASVFLFLVNFSRSSPLHKHSDHQEAKDLHFNRTMAAKTKLFNKVESSLNTTITKLSEVKERMTKVTGKVKAKVTEALSKEVEKWAAVGDKLQKKKTTFFNNLKENMSSAKEKIGRHSRTATKQKDISKSTSQQETIMTTSTTTPVIKVTITSSS